MFNLRGIANASSKSSYSCLFRSNKSGSPAGTAELLEKGVVMSFNSPPGCQSGYYVDDYPRRGRGSRGSWRQRHQPEEDHRGWSGSSRNWRRGYKHDQNAGLESAIGPKVKRERTEREDMNSAEGQKFSRHPAGLRGKAIGMWYATRNKGKGKELKEVEQHIGMDGSKASEIENLLERVKGGTMSSEPRSSADSAAAQWSGTSGEANTKDGPFLRQFMQHRLESDLKEMRNSETFASSRLSMTRDRYLDDQLLDELRRKQNDPYYTEMLEFRKKLPSYDKAKEIVETIRNNQVVVISGETGCGKTTQVPQFVLDDYIRSGNGSLCHIICTQPRRISAITVAERVANERNEPCGCGNSVGYQIRLEEKFPRAKGSIRYCTTGMVLRFLESDEWLKMASHLIIDEVHERDLDSDFLMIIVKDLLKTRPEMKLVLMSATLNAEKFSKYFGNCKMLNIPGFTYPVQEYYLEDVLEVTSYSKRIDPRGKPRFSKSLRNDGDTADRDAFLRNIQHKYSRKTMAVLKDFDEETLDLDLIHALLKHVCSTTRDGAILVFLPGWDQIKSLNNLLAFDVAFPRSRYRILPLHSLMPTVDQKLIFERPPPNIRKIVLSTNIAETSVTIDDVVYVIDSGKIKLTRLDLDLNLESIKAEWVSLANAKQRRGRAGRVQPGVCYHLYTRHREGILESYQLPAILREKLEMLCLRMKMLKLGKIEPYLCKALDPPSSVSVQLALKLLVTLNALDAEENLTPLGYHLAKLPMDPKTGKMILLGAMFACLDPILTVAACLDFKDPFVLPLGKEKEADFQRRLLSKDWNSDHIAIIEAFKGWEAAKKNRNDHQFCREHFLSPNVLTTIEKMKRQLAQHLHSNKFVESENPKEKMANINSDNMRLVRAVVCAGLYPNVAKMSIKHNPDYKRKKRGRPPAICTKEDGRVSLHPKSVNSTQTEFKSPWLVYHTKLKSSNIFLHDSTMVSAYPLIFFGGEVRQEMENGKDIVSVDNFIKFKCDLRTAKLFLDLRKQLLGLLDFKINHPGSMSWREDQAEGALINAIVELITSEENDSIQEVD